MAGRERHILATDHATNRQNSTLGASPTLIM